jgi:hypothetical protein
MSYPRHFNFSSSKIQKEKFKHYDILGILLKIILKLKRVHIYTYIFLEKGTQTYDTPIGLRRILSILRMPCGNLMNVENILG